MKVLLVGEYAWPWYQEACAGALESLGCEVVRFGWLDRFKKWLPSKSEPVYRTFMHRVQYRLLEGPTVRAVNRDLMKRALYEKPDVVWFYNVQLIHPATVRYLRKQLPHAILCQYANDNPFGPGTCKSMWRHFVAGIPYVDLHFVFRNENISGFLKRGAKHVQLLMPYFVPEANYPLSHKEIEPNYFCDAVFAGHYENDGRVEMLESICKSGYKLNLFGGGWDAALSKLSADSPLRMLYPISPVTGLNYNKAICGAKVALCFLSTLNQDTHTTRNFEIPAMKAAMLSRRTDELVRMFVEDKEAAFFSSTDELLTKLKWLLSDDRAPPPPAASGYSRVYRDGHDVVSRMRQWLDTVRSYHGRQRKVSLHGLCTI